MSEPELPKPDLSGVEMDDLLDEIAARSDAVVFTRTVKTLVEGDESKTTFFFRGNINTCIGLAYRAANELLDEARGDEEVDAEDT